MGVFPMTTPLLEVLRTDSGCGLVYSEVFEPAEPRLCSHRAPTGRRASRRWALIYAFLPLLLAA